jgi:hypothetical protein
VNQSALHTAQEIRCYLDVSSAIELFNNDYNCLLKVRAKQNTGGQ